MSCARPDRSGGSLTAPASTSTVIVTSGSFETGATTSLKPLGNAVRSKRGK